MVQEQATAAGYTAGNHKDTKSTKLHGEIIGWAKTFFVNLRDNPYVRAAPGGSVGRSCQSPGVRSGWASDTAPEDPGKVRRPGKAALRRDLLQRHVLLA